MDKFDSRELRATLGAFTTGVTVVTTIDADGNRHGVTANSFSSVSLDPPLILWSQAVASKSYPAFRDADHFVVNILAHDQMHISNQFAKSGADKFAGIAMSEGVGRVPIISGCVAHLQCVKVAAWPGGDHVVYLGRVESIQREQRKPLAFSEGRYALTFAHELGGPIASASDAAFPATVEPVRLVSAALSEICQQVGEHTIGLAAWGNRGTTIIRWEPSRRPVSNQLQTGVVLSTTQTASGLAFAAFAQSEAVEREIDLELNEFDALHKPYRAAFALEVSETQRRGLARWVGDVPFEQHQAKLNSFSAPVFNAKGEMVLAITAINRSDLLDPDLAGPVPTALLAASHVLSHALGFDRTRNFPDPSCRTGHDGDLGHRS